MAVVQTKMAVQKVNSEAESSHIAVINKVAGIAISLSYGAHNKNVEVFLKKTKKTRQDRGEKLDIRLENGARFYKSHTRKHRAGLKRR